MSTDRIAAYYAAGGGQGHTVKAVKGMQQSNGMFPIGKGWDRYNPNGEKIWVTDLYGRDRWMTRGQVTIYQHLMRAINDGHIRMRDVAEKLGVSVSTVSRTMARLMAWGLIAYISSRGRYGGTFILRRTSVMDGFERFAQKARARVKRMYQAVQRRLSRTDSNVPPFVILDEKVSIKRYTSTDIPSTHKGATLEKWDPQDLRDMGII